MNQGALLAILASLIFSVMNVLVKTIADEIPTGEIVFFRSSIGCLLIGLLMYQRGIAFSVKIAHCWYSGGRWAHCI